MAIVRSRKSQTSGQGPSLALHVQTFKHYDAFSRYTPFNKRSRSMPALSPTEQHTSDEGMDVGDQRGFNEVLTCSRYSHEQDTKIIKRNKSTSAMDDTLSEPLHMLKAKGREGVVTFGYQTISMDDIFRCINQNLP